MNTTFCAARAAAVFERRMTFTHVRSCRVTSDHRRPPYQSLLLNKLVSIERVPSHTMPEIRHEHLSLSGAKTDIDG